MLSNTSTQVVVPMSAFPWAEHEQPATWEAPEQSIGLHDEGLLVDGKYYWFMEGPALQAYATIRNNIRKEVKLRKKDMRGCPVCTIIAHTIDSFMVGNSKEEAKPSIVVACDNLKFGQWIIDVIKSAEWWEPFQAQYPGFNNCIVRRDHPRRFGGTSTPEQEEVVIRAHTNLVYTREGVRYAEDAPIFVAPDIVAESDSPEIVRQIATIGGQLFVDGEPFYLTVSHPFTTAAAASSSNISSLPLRSYELHGDIDEKKDKTLYSSELDVSSQDSGDRPYQREGVGRGPWARLGYVKYRSAGLPEDESDWALITPYPANLALLSKQVLLSEKGYIPSPFAVALEPERTTSVYLPISKSRPQFYAGTRSWETSLEDESAKNVYSIWRKAVLSAGPSLVWLDGATDYINAYVLRLNNHAATTTDMQPGCCGKWAVDDQGNWHGQVVAGCETTGLFYIAHASHIVDSIKSMTGAQQITLSQRPLRLSKLISAVCHGQETIVRDLLKDTSDLWDEDYKVLMLAACLGKQAEIVELLLDRGADIHALYGAHRKSLLRIMLGVAKSGEVRRLLIERGLSPEQQTWLSSYSALHSAVLEGDANTVQMLLESDANRYPGTAEPPLYIAAREGRQDIVLLLASLGANIDARSGISGHGDTALFVAASKGHTEVVRTLLNLGAAPNRVALKSASWRGRQKAISCETALQSACYRGNLDIVELLLDAGANANITSGPHGTALQAACSGGHKDIVKLLLDAEADINAIADPDGTALQAACFRGHKDIVKLLLDAGADANITPGPDGTALQIACRWGHDDIVELLLNAGADVNTISGPGGTALQAACAECHEDIVKLLLAAGADVNAIAGRDGTALQAACYFRRSGVVKLLLDAGADVNAIAGRDGTALQAACGRGDEDIVKLLLAAGADVNAIASPHGTALQVACTTGHEDIVKLLLADGADVNAIAAPYGTALQAARVRSYGAIVRLLLNAGSDVDATTRQARTVPEALPSDGGRGLKKLQRQHDAV